MIFVFFFFFFCVFSITSIQGCYEDPTSCDERVFDRDSFVCVCDAEYCDVTGDFSIPPEGKFKRVISSRDAYRFHVIEEEVNDIAKGDVKIEVDYETEYQEILGFGGAFSDSTGINIYSLPKEAQAKLLRSYFSEEGIEYNMARIPIAGTDFSTRPYSYDDDHENDIELQHFSLAAEDFLFKIPYIKEALSLSKDDVYLLSSIWSPPPWMKENKKHNGKGGLLRTMWDPYTNYILRFVNEYRRHNISFWGITTVNDPNAGFHDHPWNALAFSPEDMRDWIKFSLGPIMERTNMRQLKVLINDQSRPKILRTVEPILNDNIANSYVDGITVHWYEDFYTDPEILDIIHHRYKDKFILYSEACEGVFHGAKNKIQLGSWQRAENYSSNIIEDLNHHASGWVDWNMALDMKGGPNWAKNVVDSPIIVNKKEEEFYKQPMFYAMGHFSKFIKRGSRRLASRIDDHNSGNLQVVAFRLVDPDSYAFVILNKDNEDKVVSISAKRNKFINVRLNPKSLETITIKIT